MGSLSVKRSSAKVWRSLFIRGLSHTPPNPWDHALTKAQEHTVWLQARPLLNERDYSHSDWFLGTGAMPRWAGYTLGYDIVGRYLTERHQSPSDAVTTPAAKVLASFHDT